MVHERPRILGRLLVEAGRLRPEDLERVLAEERRPGERLGETLARLGLVTPEEVAQALAVQVSLPFVPAPLEPATV